MSGLLLEERFHQCFDTRGEESFDQCFDARGEEKGLSSLGMFKSLQVKAENWI